MTGPTVQPYLTFSGNCEEALAFYAKAVGAQIDFKMHFKDSPEKPPPGVLSPGFESKVMHCSFRIGSSVLMASDGCGPNGKFEGFSLSLSYTNADDATKAFNALAEGGKVTMALCKTFWSPLFGMLVDRFGVAWMVNVHAPE